MTQRIIRIICITNTGKIFSGCNLCRCVLTQCCGWGYGLQHAPQAPQLFWTMYNCMREESRMFKYNRATKLQMADWHHLIQQRLKWHLLPRGTCNWGLDSSDFYTEKLKLKKRILRVRPANDGNWKKILRQCTKPQLQSHRISGSKRHCEDPSKVTHHHGIKEASGGSIFIISGEAIEHDSKCTLTAQWNWPLSFSTQKTTSIRRQ